MCGPNVMFQVTPALWPDIQVPDDIGRLRKRSSRKVVFQGVPKWNFDPLKI